MLLPILAILPLPQLVLYIVVICYDGQNNLCDFKFLSIHILNPRQK